jgi:hypothetical protein
MLERYAIIGLVLAALVGFLLFRIYSSRQPITPLPKLADWFHVTFDETKVTMSARPPGKQSWEQSFLWSEVTRVCFKSEGLAASDDVYVFTSQRSESFVVPTEAQGGLEFWSKVVNRGLFPAELAIQAALLKEGATLCWPPIVRGNDG